MKTLRFGSRRAGSALLMTLAVVFVLSMALGSVIYMGQQRSHTASRLADRSRAIANAEAGIAQAASMLSTNFGLCSNSAAFPATSYAGGSYDVTVTPVSSNRASITSTGVYGTVREVASLDVMRVLVTSNPSAAHATNFAILAGGDLDWAGSMTLNMTGNWMHCNGAFALNGVQTIRGNVSSCVGVDSVGGSTIDGSAMAPSFTRASPGNVTGSATTTNLTPVTIPSLDLTKLYLRASSNLQVFAGTKSISGTVTPAGGVMWVDGDLNIGAGYYRGCFVATGDIEMKAASSSSSIIQVPVSNFPAFVSRDGNILVKQAKTLSFDGLIYCKTGSFDKQASGDCMATGQVIAAGNVTKNGSWAGMLYRDCSSSLWMADTNSFLVDRLMPTAWQR